MQDDVRLVDANDLCKKARPMYSKEEIDSIAPVATRAVPLHNIQTASPIDAVPVVRCGECKHRGNPDICPWSHKEYRSDGNGGHCWKITDGTVLNGFCHLGAKLNGAAQEE